jgi:hypothetical protein
MKLNQFPMSELARIAVNAMIAKSPMLAYFDFYSIVGNASYDRKASSISGGTTRTVNNDYTGQTSAPEYANPTLKIFGDKAKVDVAYERRGGDIPSLRAAELVTLSEQIGKNLLEMIFIGDASVTAAEFSGIKKQMPDAQVLTPYDNGFFLNPGTDDAARLNQAEFLEYVDQLIDLVGDPAFLAMDGKTISRITRIAEHMVHFEKNEFGRPVAFYNDIAMIPTLYDADGNRIIGHEEDCGTGEDCTSIYAVKPGEKRDLSLATNVGLQVSDLGIVGAQYVHLLDMDVDMALLNTKAIAKIEGIRLTNSGGV